jgi:hypothetical protein
MDECCYVTRVLWNIYAVRSESRPPKKAPSARSATEPEESRLGCFGKFVQSAGIGSDRFRFGSSRSSLRPTSARIGHDVTFAVVAFLADY